ncbi:MAG: minichromosome maintenance protein MCM [Candidatus Poseidoniaceae archaeon]|jgi:replicative DNA helicase Mcm|nr:minichromosome maintenance protein MCM [Candidatus Poseidoniaceae archaeon]
MTIQEFDLPARWRSLMTEQFSEAIHNLQVSWPDLQSLKISYRVIESFDPDFAVNIVTHPELNTMAANQALRLLLTELGSKNIVAFVRIVDLPPDCYRTVRQLRSEDLGQMISVEAIATKIGRVLPRTYEGSFECMACGHRIKITQPNEQELIEPVECFQLDGGCGRPKGKTRFVQRVEESILIDSQFIELQEPPENLRGGIQPERILCIAEQDLAGNLNPGDRVKANGMLFVRSQRKNGKETPIFDIFLRIHSVERENIPLEEIQISDDEEKEIKEFAKRKDIFDLFKRSIAPSIHGLEAEKESLALQLFGGVPGKSPDGTRLRGDIHILLMGDPGVAKSQLLSYMANLSPRGRFTSGMSSTGAGLTAAAVQDAAADGRWTLEAGTLALADLGLAAVDEFDKMNPNDRSAMHEAMEQQRISISKAGINATLSTRCAILAAANPKAGRFESVSEVPFTHQINLSPPLLSRFDVIWLLTDNPTKDLDTLIANHIISTRMSATPELLIEQGSRPDPTKVADSISSTTQQAGHEIITREMMKKYVAYAKRSCHPTITEEAKNMIVEFYVETRRAGGEQVDSVAITARGIEAVYRLAQASARIRLNDKVEVEDANRAIRITRTWRFKLMGDNYDETTLQSGKKPTKRNRERQIIEIVRRIHQETGDMVPIIDVFTQAEKGNISRDIAEEIIDALVIDGRLIRPRGYEHLTPGV